MHIDYGEILRREITPALGCTEPMAVSLAVARAAETAGRPIERVSVQVSRNILKNAMNVGIPGTDMVGLDIAAALAAIGGDSAAGLEVLGEIQEHHIAAARDLLRQERVDIALAQTDRLLYIRAVCHGERGCGEVVIENTHTGIASVRLNGQELAEPVGQADFQAAARSDQAMTLAGIYRFSIETPPEDLAFLLQAVEMNERIAEEGISNGSGAAIGKHLLASYTGGTSPGELGVYAAAYAAAASDARMADSGLPVMTTAGSGNQGLTATLPVAVLAKRLNAGQDAMLQALALSQLVTIFVKRHIGSLSALCGCAVAASIGTACGITLLYGGTYGQVEAAVINMVADISGMICDGAKAGCALKIATAVSCAMQCAQLALGGVVISGRDGIVCRDADSTIANLGRLANPGMVGTDRVILDMMLAKGPGDHAPVPVGSGIA
ncbi:L-serine ammonia-lyase, iron-sulfur-dependent, subunit alpha [Ruminococcaceae bacterium OttesenSCG-928-L11]|nr:L-serine ammonia-lyase, iron-sulfur-dependent, subunit alpha [Ruminococcaceae bacterium OttesenSCG-928-L11]